MAASIFRSRLLQTLKNTRRYATKKRLVGDGGYYILLPEIPPDTPETNPVLRVDSYPKYSQMSPDKIVTGCAKAALCYEIDMQSHIDKLKDIEGEKTFESVMEPMDKLGVTVGYAWRTARNLAYLVGGDYKLAHQRAHGQVELARMEKWATPELYEAAKEVYANKEKLTEAQIRYLEMYFYDSKYFGVEITEKDRKKFVQTAILLAHTTGNFRKHVNVTHSMFSHELRDFEEVADLPKSLVYEIAADKTNPSRGPWKLTLDGDVYGPFMAHSNNRPLRFNLFNARTNRASRHFIQTLLTNHMIIGEIRNHRTNIAEMIGYENFADMVISNKMAGTVDNVLNMIESYKSHYKPLAIEEIATLQEFAKSNGFEDKIEMWDISYWTHRHEKYLYRLDEDTIAAYFPYNKAVERLFNICSTLFGIKIQNCSDEVDIYHPHVSFYKIFDSNTNDLLGAFYLDPFTRPHGKMDGIWVSPGRERCQAFGITPFCHMNLNIPAPRYAGQEVLLGTSELTALASGFGSVLQTVLDTTPYTEISGQKNIERDAIFVISNLIEKILFNKHVLKSISCHVDTGESLPEDIINTWAKQRRHLHSYNMMYMLYVSAFDMEVNFTKDYWGDVQKKVWEEFMPMPAPYYDEHPCNMINVFCDLNATVNYGVIWSDMIASDLFKAFEDVGFEDLNQTAVVGQRFRESYLSYGGGLSASEAFRRFMGRDPSQDSLIEYYEKS